MFVKNLLSEVCPSPKYLLQTKAFLTIKLRHATFPAKYQILKKQTNKQTNKKRTVARSQSRNRGLITVCYKFNEQHDALEFYKHVSADTSTIFSVKHVCKTQERRVVH